MKGVARWIWMKAAAVIRWAVDRLRWVVDRLLTSFIVVAAILVFFSSAMAIGFLAIDLAARISPSASAPPWAQWIADSGLQLLRLGPEELKADQLASIAPTVLSFLYAFVTVWFALGTAVAFVKHRTAVKRAQIVETHPVATVGVEDLDTMYKFYSKGQKITVFSGDFDWILEHKNLRALIEKLAGKNKITLVSYKGNRSRVKRSF